MRWQTPTEKNVYDVFENCTKEGEEEQAEERGRRRKRKGESKPSRLRKKQGNGTTATAKMTTEGGGGREGEKEEKGQSVQPGASWWDEGARARQDCNVAPGERGLEPAPRIGDALAPLRIIHSITEAADERHHGFAWPAKGLETRWYQVQMWVFAALVALMMTNKHTLLVTHGTRVCHRAKRRRDDGNVCPDLVPPGIPPHDVGMLVALHLAITGLNVDRGRDRLSQQSGQLVPYPIVPHSDVSAHAAQQRVNASSLYLGSTRSPLLPNSTLPAHMIKKRRGARD